MATLCRIKRKSWLGDFIDCQGGCLLWWLKDDVRQAVCVCVRKLRFLGGRDAQNGGTFDEMSLIGMQPGPQHLVVAAWAV